MASMIAGAFIYVVTYAYWRTTFDKVSHVAIVAAWVMGIVAVVAVEAGWAALGKA